MFEKLEVRPLELSDEAVIGALVGQMVKQHTDLVIERRATADIRRLRRDRLRQCVRNELDGSACESRFTLIQKEVYRSSRPPMCNQLSRSEHDLFRVKEEHRVDRPPISIDYFGGDTVLEKCLELRARRQGPEKCSLSFDAERIQLSGLRPDPPCAFRIGKALRPRTGHLAFLVLTIKPPKQHRSKIITGDLGGGPSDSVRRSQPSASYPAIKSTREKTAATFSPALSLSIRGGTSPWGEVALTAAQARHRRARPPHSHRAV